MQDQTEHQQQLVSPSTELGHVLQSPQNCHEDFQSSVLPRQT